MEEVTARLHFAVNEMRLLLNENKEAPNELSGQVWNNVQRWIEVVHTQIMQELVVASPGDKPLIGNNDRRRVDPELSEPNLAELRKVTESVREGLQPPQTP